MGIISDKVKAVLDGNIVYEVKTKCIDEVIGTLYEMCFRTYLEDKIMIQANVLKPNDDYITLHIKPNQMRCMLLNHGLINILPDNINKMLEGLRHRIESGKTDVDERFAPEVKITDITDALQQYMLEKKLNDDNIRVMGPAWSGVCRGVLETIISAEDALCGDGSLACSFGSHGKDEIDIQIKLKR